MISFASLKVCKQQELMRKPYYYVHFSVVRHMDICINNEGANDKFRIQVSEHGQRKILGKSFVDSVFLHTGSGYLMF